MEDIASLFGFLGLGLTAISFAIPHDRAVRMLNLFGCLAWLCHFLFLGVLFPFLMLVLATTMIAGSVFGKDKITYYGWLCNCVLLGLALVAWVAGVIEAGDVLPILGGFFINTGVSRFKGGMLTGFVFVGTVFWILTGISLDSNSVIAANVLNCGALCLRVFGRHIRRDVRQ